MTYRKIAQLANVSLSTVSKALSGSKEIREDLREEIIRIAIEQGYFAEKGRRKIEYAKNGAITAAIVCPEIISIAYAGEITAVKEAIEERGGLASIYVYDFDREQLNRIIETITVRNCADGIIMFPPGPFSTGHSIPIVGICSYDMDYDTIHSDVGAYFLDVVSYLKELGHREIVFVGETNTVSKLEAFRKSMEKCGLPCGEDSVYIIEERFEAIGYQAAKEIMGRSSLPTAVICAYDEIAMALIHSLTEKGIRVPEQISVVGINDIPMAAYSQVPLTTVRVFQENQGEIAVNLLYDKIFGRSEVIQHITVKHELVKRKSTGRARTEGEGQ